MLADLFPKFIIFSALDLGLTFKIERLTLAIIIFRLEQVTFAGTFDSRHPQIHNEKCKLQSSSHPIDAQSAMGIAAGSNSRKRLGDGGSIDRYLADV